jgi:hypothetical protein
MGILDPNTRIVDTILTVEGRRQLALGGLDVSFYTFDDAGVIYDDDGHGIIDDAAKRLSLEARQLPQDTLVSEANELGELLSSISGSITIIGGRAFNASGSANISTTPVDDDAIIASLDPSTALQFNSSLHTVSMLDAGAFDVKPASIRFIVMNDMPLSQRQQLADLDHIDPFFADPTLAHIINFAYLPPQNLDGTQLGNYQPIGPDLPPNDADITRLTSTAQNYTTYMSPAPLENRIAIQMVAVSNGKVNRLAAVDRGTIGTSRIVHYGRVFRNSRGQFVFCRLFTVTISR